MITLLACSVSGSDHAEMPSSCLDNRDKQSWESFSSLLCPLAVFGHLHDAQTVPSIGATHQLCLPSVSARMLPSPSCSPHRSHPTSRRLAPRPLLSSVPAEADGKEDVAVGSYLWQWPWWQVQLSLAGTQPGLPSGQRQWALSSWSWHCCPGWHRLGAHKGTSQNWPVGVGGRGV